MTEQNHEENCIWNGLNLNSNSRQLHE